MNSEDGFRLKVFAGNGRKRSRRRSASSTGGEIEMIQRRAVAAFAQGYNKCTHVHIRLRGDDHSEPSRSS